MINGTFQQVAVASTNPNLPRINEVRFPYVMTTPGLSKLQMTIKAAPTKVVTFKLASNTGEFFSDAAGTISLGREITYNTSGLKTFYFRATASGSFVMYNSSEVSTLGSGGDWSPNSNFLSDENNARITGFDIAQLALFPNLTAIIMNGHWAFGDLAVFSTLTNIITIVITDSTPIGSLYGTLAGLTNKASLTTIRIGGAITFDFSLLPNNLLNIQLDNMSTKIRHTGVTAVPPTFAFRSGGFLSMSLASTIASDAAEVDKILLSLDTAQASASPKNVRIKGSRTSASDAAIASLASKNYTLVFTT